MIATDNLPQITDPDIAEVFRVAGVCMVSLDYIVEQARLHKREMGVTEWNAYQNARVQYDSLVYRLNLIYNPDAARRMRQSSAYSYLRPLFMDEEQS